MAFHSTYPTTGEVWRTFEEASAGDVELALVRAAAARPAWAATPIADRARHLRAVAARLRAQKAEHAVLMAREMGEPVADGEAEVEKCAVGCEWYADHGARLLAPDPRELDGA